jgi:predicted nucleic acid-binding protein
MSAECFVDTNLFIYQLEALDARKTATADRIIRQGIETGNACISFQVVQECLNTRALQHRCPDNQGWDCREGTIFCQPG